MSDLKVNLIIRMIEKVVAPAKAVSGAMNRVAEVAAKATRATKGTAVAAAQVGATTAKAFTQGGAGASAYTAQVERSTRATERLGRAAKWTGDQAKQAAERAAASWKGVQDKLNTVGNRAVLGGGAMAAGLGLHRAIGSSIKAEDQQAALANIAELSGTAQKAMGQALRQEVKHTNRSILELTSGLGVLMGAGWDDTKGLAAIRAIGRTATAEKAVVEDLSRTVLAGVDNLKVPVEQMGKYLDVLAKAGKLGNFELKDMSQYLPSIGGMAQTLGVGGMKGTAQIAAALQVARGQTGKSEEAGTNTMNFLMKLAAPETERNFAKVGVNLGSELKKGRASGDLMGHMGSLIKRLTDGDEMKMGRLFGDMQVKLFLNPFLANLEKYKQIQEQALAASGVVERDFERMKGTTAFKMDRASNAVDDVVDTKLKPWLDRFNKVLDLFDRNPKLLDALITGLVVLVGGGLLAKATAGVMGLWGALKKVRDLQLVSGLMGSTWFQGLGQGAVEATSKLVQMDRARFGFSPSALRFGDKFRLGFSTDWIKPATYSAQGKTIGQALMKGVKAPFTGSFWSGLFKGGAKLMPSLGGANSLFSGAGLAGAGGGLLGALKGIGGAMLFPIKAIGGVIAAVGAPALAILAAVALAGLLIYKYWEPIKAFFAGIWEGFKANLDLVMPAWDAFSDAIGGVFKALLSLAKVFLPVQEGQEDVNGAFENGKAVGEGLAWVFGIVLTAAKWVAQGVEGVVITVATLLDALVMGAKTIWKALTGDWKNIGKDWSGFSDRFWKRLENSSMNPDKVAEGPNMDGPSLEQLQGTPSPSASPEQALRGSPQQALRASLPPQSGAAGSIAVEVNYHPKVEIRGTPSQEDKAWFLKQLEANRREIVRLVEEGLAAKVRWNPGGVR